MREKSSSCLTWIQVADILKKRLSSGDYDSGKLLPSYREIASELNVSLSVCQRAMGQLRREGLVRVSQGRNGQIGDPEGLKNDFSFYGVIHPYNPRGSFGSFLNARIMEAFSDMSPISFPLIASSMKKEEDELKIAGKMLHNRVRGLLISPATGSGNGAFFTELSKKIPVVLFDQELSGSELPLVKFDYASAGRELGTALKKSGRKRVLLLFQEHPNLSLQEFAAALEEKIPTRICTIELFNYTVSSVREQNFALIETLCSRITDMIRESGCDALFCPYDSIMDTLILNGLPESVIGKLQLATLREDNYDLLSPQFLKHDIWQWHFSHLDLIGAAAHRLFRWEINHHRPALLKKIPMTRVK